jgi:AcrR family transcriptional regulator
MTGWNSGAWPGSPGVPAVERRAHRREQFFAVGLELFGRDGYAMTSIERLCAAAGATTREFYPEFADREELLLAIHDRITTEAMTAMSSALAATTNAPLGQRIEAAVRAYVGVTAADLGRARVAYVEVVGISPAVERYRLAWRERFVTLFSAAVEQAVRRGEAPVRDYRLTAIAVVGTLNELAYRWAIDPQRPPRTEIETELIRLIHAAITAGPTPDAGPAR